jgi:hypothetical protein
MAASTFQTNPIDLHKLLEDCHHGVLQLPDFQRSWVWDEDRIKSLIASVSRAFPVGALMSLDTGGPVNFKPRPVEGAPTEAKQNTPQSLLLDGQQRITSQMYDQTTEGLNETVRALLSGTAIRETKVDVPGTVNQKGIKEPKSQLESKDPAAVNKKVKEKLATQCGRTVVDNHMHAR